MAATHDSRFVQCHFTYPADQGESSNDRLSVDVVVLYISWGDGFAESLPDFVFQDQRQSPEVSEEEPARNPPAISPTSPDLLERGQHAPGLDAKAQPGTDKDVGARKGPYLRTRRPSRRLSIADRRVNWLLDGQGQLFRKAIQPLTLTRIIGVSIDLKSIYNLSFAQAAKEVGKALRKHCIGRPMVFLCHGYATFFLKDVLEADEDVVLRPSIAAIGMFGVNPKDSDISELKKWTAEKRSKVSLQSPIFKDDCQNDFGNALNDLRKDHFISVFAFRADVPEGAKPEESTTMFSVSDRDPMWSGGGLDQVATFSGLEDAGFRGMCKYIVESVEGHQLLTAARENDRDMIMTLIRRGANIDGINYTSRDHKTALAIAAEAGHVETVEFLSTKDYVSLDHGVELEKSALHCAVKAIKDLVGKIPQDEIDYAYEYDRDPAAQILSLLKNGGLPLDDEIKKLEDMNELHHQVKQLARTMKVVERLLEAGALPSGGLINTLNVHDPLEKAVKQLLSNPPAVQGPSPRKLVVSTPSEQALTVCRNTPFVIREVFSVAEDKKDRYIPVYTDIHQVIYQKKSPTQIPQTGSSCSSPSDMPSPAVAASGPTITFQANESPATTAEPKVMTLDTSQNPSYNMDQEFNIDNEFSRRRENFKEAGSEVLCRWYHIPINNMAWVHDLFAKLKVHVWPWPQGYRDYKPQSRAVYPQFVKPKPLVANSTKSSPSVHAIMIPYLSYEQSLRTLITGLLESRVSGQPDEDEDAGEMEEYIFKKIRRESREDRWMNRLMSFSFSSLLRSTQGRSHFDFSDTYRRNQTEMDNKLAVASASATFVPQATALTNAYLNYKHDLGYKLPLHPRLTLDQSHYYMLRDTTYRDRTQVVSRWFRRNRRAKTRERFYTRSDQALFEEEDHNILMVDQLWIWLIKDDKGVHQPDATQGKVTLVTSFPDRFGTKSAARNNIAQQVFRDSTRDPFRNVSDLVRQIISVCLRTLNEARVDGSVSFLQCFEISLGNLEERSGQSFLEFRRLSEFLEHLDENHPDYLSRRGLLLKMLLKISKDSRILSEVKDILDEIGMIQRVLQDQENVLSDDDGELHHLLGAWRERAPLYSELRRMIGNFEQLKQRAQSVVDSIEKLLDMKQKHANLWEARTSREGSDVAAKAGNTLWWFTAVTIIFLPLSFMASFFALDIDKFPKDDGGDTNWPLDTVVGLLFGISLAFIIPLYILAFFSENLQRTWSRLRGIWLPLIELPILWTLDKIPRLPLTLRFIFWHRSFGNILVVRKYDPKFEKIIERMMGENGTEVINDDDLDEEDDLIREWRRYYNKRRGIL